jgi:hypothetical protein
MITELARRKVLLGLERDTDSRLERLAEDVAQKRITLGEAADSLLGERKGGREERTGRGSNAARARKKKKKKKMPAA